MQISQIFLSYPFHVSLLPQWYRLKQTRDTWKG